MLGQLRYTLDLSEVPPVEQRQLGTRKVLQLVDVLKRHGLPNPLLAPDASDVSANSIDRWRVPGTEIVLRRIVDGTRAGEFLISADTVARLDEYERQTRSVLGAGGGTWLRAGLATYGWMIPPVVVESLPDWAWAEVLDDPLWKLIGTGLFSLLVIGGVLVVQRITWPSAGATRIQSHLLRLLTPVAIVVGAMLYEPFVADQLGLLGSLAILVEVVSPLLFYVGLAWLLWHTIFLLAEVVIASPRIDSDSLDANLIRLAAQVVGFGAIVLCLVRAADGFGVPVLGIAAGLGAGGLAFGLAAQGSIENLIGALTIYFDRSVRAGDYCTGAGVSGFVERVGLRTTTIRRLDRTEVTIPNAMLVRGEITNYSRRDMFLFSHTLHVVYGTSPEMLRTFSARVVEEIKGSDWYHPSPAIPARAPVIRFGDWSIQLDVLAYLSCADYGEFLAAQSELIARLVGLANQMHVEYAIPSQTISFASEAPTEPSSPAATTRTQ